ncbi:MAG: S41 family peptidase [Oligoflexia bacterium]|nr:S41 family peptidase [Oligoflexia bacterium]
MLKFNKIFNKKFNKKINIFSLLITLSMCFYQSQYSIENSFAAEKSKDANKVPSTSIKIQPSSNKNTNDTNLNSKSRFEYLELFNKILFMIETQYYRDVDTGKLVQGAIKGMMETLDPHSSYLDKEIFNKMQDDTSGEFGGLGIEVTQKDGVIYIITPLDDTPAYKAGLKAGDKIVEIEHESSLGLTLEEAVKKMKGEIGTKIILGIIREGVSGIRQFEIVREKIKTKSVKFELIDNNYAFIRLTQFQSNSGDSIRKAIQKLREDSKKNNGLLGIVLDLRSNPGGLLDEAVEVASIFLKEGTVVSIEGRNEEKREVRYVSQASIEQKEIDLPLIVLINGASASASEIVAGALQDHKRAIIMGSQSFGKGSVQSVAKIDEENGVKLTIAQYLTPLKRKIQAVGIRPDIELDEVDASWVTSNSKPARYMRERDLKNYLSATIETEVEKEMRVKREKEERSKRIKEMEEKRKDKEKDKYKTSNNKNIKNNNDNDDDDDDSDLFKKYEAKNDYQVLQAVNFLKSFKIFKSFLNK